MIVEESNLPSQVHAIPRELAQAPSAGSKRSPSAAIVGPVRAAGDALRTVEAGQSNLPQALTSFIGRERDLVEIKRLLPSKRLITVVGTGGIGKTRLALQPTVEVTSAYRDGVCFIDLGPLRDAALVPAAVARALGVQERSGKPLSAALCERLRPLQIRLFRAVSDIDAHLSIGITSMGMQAVRRVRCPARRMKLFPVQPPRLEKGHKSR